MRRLSTINVAHKCPQCGHEHVVDIDVDEHIPERGLL